MTLLCLLACIRGTEVDSATRTADSEAPAPVGTLTASPSSEMVTEATLHGIFDQVFALELRCAGLADTRVPEEHLWRAETASSEHTAVLRGLLADTDYTCRAVGTEAEVAFSTGSLPEALASYEITLETWEPAAQPGWNLVVPLTFHSLFEQSAVYLVVLDMEGAVRWYREPDTADGILTFDHDAEHDAFWSGGGLVEPAPPTAYDLSGQVTAVLSSEADHDVDWFEDSAYALIATGAGAYCIEQRRWEDDELEWSICGDELGHGSLKLNALDVRREDGEVVIYGGSASSSRAVKIHRDRRESLWIFGEGADFTGVPEFTYTHDFNGLDCTDYESCVSYYDNREEGLGSRAVIWGLDEAAGVATELFSWEEAGWYEPRLGGMQVLDEGHVLVGRGHLELLAPGGGQSWVTEVDAAGEVVWRLLIGPLDRSIYRARRLPPCRLFGHLGYCETPLR